jgi:hypothetical protein
MAFDVSINKHTHHHTAYAVSTHHEICGSGGLWLPSTSKLSGASIFSRFLKIDQLVAHFAFRITGLLQQLSGLSGDVH